MNRTAGGRAVWAIDAVALAGALALFAAFAPGIVNPAPYGYDEADYMWAANLGFRANYLDSGTMAASGFLRLGLQAARHQITGGGLSAYIRGRNDVLFYRHYHGPLYYNVIHATAPFHDADERGTRGAGLLLQALSCVALYGGVRWLIKGTEGRIAAILFAVLYLFSSAQMEAATVIAPHIVFIFVALAATILAAKWMRTGRWAYWYAAVAASAAATCTLEVGMGLIPALIACCWFQRRECFKGWTPGRLLGFAARSAVVWAGALVVVWPPSLMKLSLLKGCFFMAYLAGGRSAAFGGTAFLNGWRLRLLASPVEWMVVGAGVVISIVMFRRRKGFPVAALPILAFGVTMLLAMLRVSTNMSKYTIIYLAPLELFGCILLGYGLARLRPWLRYGLPGLICAGAIAACAWHFQPIRAAGGNLDPASWRLIEFARQEQLGTSRALVPQDLLPTLHFYFPKATLLGYRDTGEIASLAAGRRLDGALLTEPVLKYSRFAPGRAEAGAR